MRVKPWPVFASSIRLPKGAFAAQLHAVLPRTGRGVSAGGMGQSFFQRDKMIMQTGIVEGVAGLDHDDRHAPYAQGLVHPLLALHRSGQRLQPQEVCCSIGCSSRLSSWSR